MHRVNSTRETKFVLLPFRKSYGAGFYYMTKFMLKAIFSCELARTYNITKTRTIDKYPLCQTSPCLLICEIVQDAHSRVNEASINEYYSCPSALTAVSEQ